MHVAPPPRTKVYLLFIQPPKLEAQKFEKMCVLYMNNYIIDVSKRTSSSQAERPNRTNERESELIPDTCTKD